MSFIIVLFYVNSKYILLTFSLEKNDFVINGFQTYVLIIIIIIIIIKKIMFSIESGKVV